MLRSLRSSLGVKSDKADVVAVMGLRDMERGGRQTCQPASSWQQCNVSLLRRGDAGSPAGLYIQHDGTVGGGWLRKCPVRRFLGRQSLAVGASEHRLPKAERTPIPGS